MEKVLLLLLVVPWGLASDCVPGKITGIGCPAIEDIISDYQPSINDLKTKIHTISKTTADSIVSTRILIRNNILSAKNLTNHQLLDIRRLLHQAQLEALRASPKIKACIRQQSIETAKLNISHYINCTGNIFELENIFKKMLSVENVLTTLVSFCSRLNPLQSELSSFKLCLEEKMADVNIQILALEKEFVGSVQNIVNYSTMCVMKESGVLHTKIGAIEGAVKNCKNV